MTHRLLITPLRRNEFDELAELLMHEPVYRHIGGLPASVEEFKLDLATALAGPPSSQISERWLHFSVRRADDGVLLGRMEATLHDGIAEVAFVFGPAHWGQGYATEGLHWLHSHIDQVAPGTVCWAAVLPANDASRAVLRRAGYAIVPVADAPRLYSHDDGDLVFRRG